jgi:hypothetical protein
VGPSLARLAIVDAQDQRRGKLPEIVSDEKTMTFILKIVLGPSCTCKLVLRCDRDGGIYACLDRS